MMLIIGFVSNKNNLQSERSKFLPIIIKIKALSRMKKDVIEYKIKIQCQVVFLYF